MKTNLYNALKLKYQAEILEAYTNLMNYFENKVAVAEHPNIIKSMDKLVEELGTAEDKLKTLQENFDELTRH
jgi:uncharacterized protein (DUF342 family)|tara:strand:- start:859 stop:1074 length:216 start_codon:yes stop_codon:yes gene_type:complete